MEVALCRALCQQGGWRGDNSLSPGQCLRLVSPPEMPLLRGRRKELPPMAAAEPCMPNPRCWVHREPSSPTAHLHSQRQSSLWIASFIHTSQEKPGAGSPANPQPPVLPLQPADIGLFPQHPREQLAAKKRRVTFSLRCSLLFTQGKLRLG